MKQLGYKWLNLHRIIKIDPNKYVTAVSYSDKSDCGFLVENMWEMSPNQKNRSILSFK